MIIEIYVFSWPQKRPKRKRILSVSAKIIDRRREGKLTGHLQNHAIPLSYRIVIVAIAITKGKRIIVSQNNHISPSLFHALGALSTVRFTKNRQESLTNFISY